MKNIVLIGMPACGKSTLGVVLAKTLGRGFIDTDLIIQQQQKRLLQDIINTDGLEHFLDCERDAVMSVICENCVIATGGSVVFRDDAMRHLKENGTVVFIDVPVEMLEARLSNIRTRGIAAAKGETVAEIYSERLPYYKKYADIVLTANGDNIEQSVEELIRMLGE